MENTFQVQKALGLYTARTGLKCGNELAAKLWPNSSKTTQMINLRNLINGKTKTLDSYAIIIICKTTGCDPNFLLGWEK